jgi:hypothetical protein
MGEVEILRRFVEDEGGKRQLVGRCHNESKFLWAATAGGEANSKSRKAQKGGVPL